MSRVLISIPYARCLKTFLDTPIYDEIKARHSVGLMSYLTRNPGFTAKYGGTDVRFYGKPHIRGPLRSTAYKLMDASRFLGFLFRWRARHSRNLWTMLVNSKANSKGRPPWVRAALVVASVLGDRLRIDRLINRFLGDWIFFDFELHRLFREERPEFLICTAFGSEQENILCHYARRYGVRTMLVPNTLDAFLINGFLGHAYHRICAPGPKDRWLLEHLHHVPPDRIINLGVMSNRSFERLARTVSYAVFRERQGIAPHTRIIYYLSTTPAFYLDLIPTIDHLLGAISNGQLANCVIVLRAVPPDDIPTIRARYGTNPLVRIQIAGPKSLGILDDVDFTKGDEDYVEFLETLMNSSLMVMSGLTTAVYHAALFGVPVVSSVVELSAYPWWSMSPRRMMQDDTLDIYARGLPAASTLDELVQMIQEALVNPDESRAVGRQILDDWDYQNPNYVQDVLSVLS